LAQRAAHAIRDAILLEQYKPGQRLREVELVEGLGVSNSVIREAFLVLEAEGIVVNDPYCGRSVYRLEESEARDLYILRASLESLAAFLAAERLDTESSKRISEVARRMKSDFPARFPEWINLELEFHRTVWETAQNRWLYKQLNQFSVPMYALSTLHHFRPDYDLEKLLSDARIWERTNHVQGHQRMARAILSGKPEVARESALLHVMGRPNLALRRREIFRV
jgi:DNA-binding GntR family transcriptional regulator